jgi:cytochrome c nitrite reductase small subunit
MKFALILGIASLLVVVGAGLYATDFTAYLGNDPTACNNCHVMDAAYESWYHGSHKAWATCNDCHTPHDLIPKYIVKATSGYHHVTAFVSGNIPDAIRAKTSSREVVQENCRRCHLDTVESIADGTMDAERYCFECHRDTAHGERGISLLPYRDQETDQ